MQTRRGDRNAGGGPTGRGRERATATTLSYVLTLAITAVLASGLLIAGGGVVENQRQETTADALEVVGQQLGSRLAAADRLVNAGDANVTVRGSYPDTIAGSTYAIEVRAGPPTRLVLTATRVDASVTITVATETPVATGSLAGGDVVIVVRGGDLEVRAA